LETIDQAGIGTEPSQAISVQEYVQATGVVEPDESYLGHVRPVSEGIVHQVFVQKGDRVRKGQPLISYDNIELGELMGVYKSNQAELSGARAQREVKRRLWERDKELFNNQLIAEKDLELREAEYIDAREVVRKWEASMAQVEIKLHRYGLTIDQIQELRTVEEIAVPSHSTLTKLNAPFDGTVIGYDVAEGEVVAPERVLLTIANLGTVWTMADIYERDLGAILGARHAEINFEAYPGQRFKGRITYLGDVLDPESRTVKVRCVIPNPDSLLKLGMFATIKIPTEESRRLPAVPADAVQLIDGEPVLFVETSKGTFEKRAVRTGPERDRMVVIEQGLKVGEVVVTEGSFALKSELLREQLGGGHAH
jgi:cobalt-zinc-cadmium efflux system membrane fusion protein